MQFSSLPYAYLLALLPLILALQLYTFWRQPRMLAAFASSKLLPRLLPAGEGARRWLRPLVLVAGVASLIVALMQPQWGKSVEDAPRQGRDLIVLLDTSLSMLAEDAAPNRLEQAKDTVRQLVRLADREGGHRLGLVAFAGRASLHCPLTLDYDFFLQRLDEVDTGTVVPGGTVIGDALRQTLQSFGELDPDYTDLILLTDGEDHGSVPVEAARAAAAYQVSLYAIGFGDPASGAPIPVEDANGGAGFLQYQGQEVRSRMQPSLLLEMARLGGGGVRGA